METVLIVDDEPNVRNVYSRLLTFRGYRALTSPDVPRAREILMREPVDLMLLDINMGNIGGDVLYEISSMFHKNVRIIVTSVYPIEDQRRMIGEASDYYDKSESLTVLLQKVGRLLDGSKPGILVVDDDPVFIKACHVFFKQAGYVSDECEDLVAALKFLAKEIDRIDLIVLDLSFGDLAMVEFLRTVKTKKRGIRFMIASSLPIKEQKYYMPTANDYFDKADGKEALLTKVHKLLAPVPELTHRKEVEK